MKLLFYKSKFSEMLRQQQDCIKINTDSRKFADVGQFRRMTVFGGKNDVIMASLSDDYVKKQNNWQIVSYNKPSLLAKFHVI